MMEKLEIEYLKPGDYYYKLERKRGYESVECHICKGTGSIQHTIADFNNGEPFLGKCPCCTEGETHLTPYSYYVTSKHIVDRVCVTICENGVVELTYRSLGLYNTYRKNRIFTSFEECEARVKELNETTDGIVYKKD